MSSVQGRIFDCFFSVNWLANSPSKTTIYYLQSKAKLWLETSCQRLIVYCSYVNITNSNLCLIENFQPMFDSKLSFCFWMQIIIHYCWFGKFPVNWLDFTHKNHVAEEHLSHTAGSNTIFIQIYMDAPPGVPGVSKNSQKYATNKTVELLN